MRTDYSYLESEEYNVEIVEAKENQSLSATDTYIDFLFPSLSANENIALTRKIKSKYFRTEFLDKDYLKRRLNSGGLRDCDTFISLSTCVAADGKVAKSAEHMHRRYCLGFDFDKKDFKKKFSTIHGFTKHFYSTTGLYIHFAIDSGHGYHFYVGIEETTDIPRVTSITRRYAVLSGADRVNISDAQTLRLPGTLNHKDPESPLAVNIVFRYKDEGFLRYTLDYLESRLKLLEKAAGIGRPVNRKKSITYKFRGMYPCIANMLNNGVPKGERNRCLGRIAYYFRDVAKISQNEALEIVLQWNVKCNALCIDTEQKSDDEVTKDLRRYWIPKDGKVYSLLGCVSENNSFSATLIKYCDETQCPKKRRGPEKDNMQYFTLDNRYITDKCLHNLNGFAYLILRVLLDSKAAYKVSELVILTDLSEQTVSRYLKALLNLGLICKSTEGVAATYKAKNYARPKEKQFVTLPVKLFDMLITKKISEQELVLYIAIRRNAYNSKKCTYEDLGKILGIDKMTVYRIVKRMTSHSLLEADLRPTGNFIKNGGKSIEKHYNYYHFILEEQNEEDTGI